MLQLPMGSIGGAQLVLIAALSHFPELGPKLELLEFRRNADLTESQLDALWTWKRRASESLSSRVPQSVARNSPDDIGEE
jgi:hypothetical protein